MATGFKASRLFLLACLIGVLWLLLQILSPFLTPILLAIVLATLFYPLYARLNRAVGRRPSWTALAMCVVITFLIVIPVSLLAMTLATETQQALNDYQKSVESGGLGAGGGGSLLALWERISKIPGVPKLDITASAQAAVREAALFLFRNSSAILAGVATMVADFFIMIFTLFFSFRDGEAFVHELLQFIPLDDAQKRRTVLRLKETIVATFMGTFITAAAQGIATWMILLILGFRRAALWGALAALTSLVPLVGTSLVWVPSSIFLLLRGEWGRALVLIAYGALVISTLDNVLRPLLIRRTSQNMHTLLIFFGILGGMSAFGFSGLILGPVVIAFTLAIAEMVRLEFREEAE